MSKVMLISKIFFLSVALIMTTNVVFAASSLFDDGVDENGDVVVSPSLALRCGISSDEAVITADCIDRLAYDYKSGKIVGFSFSNYNDERKVIISEYVAAYLKNGLEQLVEASGYDDKIGEEMCMDDTKSSCMSVSKDSRDEMEYNNKMATINATILLDAVKLRAQELNLISLETLLNNVVPARDVNLSNKSLAGAP